MPGPIRTSSILKFKKLTGHARTPTKGSKKAAGYDLYRYVSLLILLLGINI